MRFSYSKDSPITVQKLTVARELGLVTEQNATVLRIGHSYRNAAYHRDSHNPRISGLLGRILLSSTLQLFADNFDSGISFGGVRSQGWLASYGIEGTSFSLRGASSAIALKLKYGMDVPLPECRDVFTVDIRERVADVEKRIAKLGIPSPDDVDEGLKRAEFEQQFPKESYSAELHKLNYQIVSGERDAVTTQRYKEAEESSQTKLSGALKAFTPVASLATLRAVKDSRRLAKAQNIAALLQGYEDLDNKLSVLGSALDGVEEALDRAAEYLEDLRRGK
jgi:hypothetical protein